MPVLTEVAPVQRAKLSSTLVERLARREEERREGRSSLKARLRRWVGSGSRRQLGKDIDRNRGVEAREMEAGGMEAIETEARGLEEAREMECSIDSGIGLDSSSSCLSVKEEDKKEGESWTTVEPTPILRSSRASISIDSQKARGTVKKSISFSDGHAKSTRWVTHRGSE